MAKSLLLETSNELEHAVASIKDTSVRFQYAKLKELRRRYSKLASEGSREVTQLQSLKHAADSLDKILTQTVSAYADYQKKLNITATDVIRQIKPTEAVIEFLRYQRDTDSSNRYFAMVLRHGSKSPIAIDLGSEDEIAASVKYRDFNTQYDMIWSPLESYLKNVTTIYYSPSGVLNNVSFAALCRQKKIKAKQSSIERIECEYLMDRYALHRLTTTRYVADGTLTKSRKIGTSIALYGSIDYDYAPTVAARQDTIPMTTDFADVMRSMPYLSPVSALPATSTEIASIEELMQKVGWGTMLYRNQGADEKSFKSLSGNSAPSILHIATHGFAFPEKYKRNDGLSLSAPTLSYHASEDPMVRCGLMFSGANHSWTGNANDLIQNTGEDGILTAAEVAELDLAETDLVVLSACNSGLGRVDATEGTYGLQRAFKLAGVKNLIVSLWPVPDQETMELMTSFYADLAISKDPATSFQRAQLSMRKAYPQQPEKWAGFVFVR